MPCIGLIISSACFIIPGILAWRKKHHVETVASGLITATSIGYHGTLHPFFKAVDMTVAHVAGIGALVKSVHRLIRKQTKRHRWTSMAVVGGTTGSIAVYWFKSKNNPYASSALWHQLFHHMAQLTWMVHLGTHAPVPSAHSARR